MTAYPMTVTRIGYAHCSTDKQDLTAQRAMRVKRRKRYALKYGFEIWVIHRLGVLRGIKRDKNRDREGFLRKNGVESSSCIFVSRVIIPIFERFLAKRE
jgi:hypothetical protein